MAAPGKYGDELRERATRMAVEARAEPGDECGVWPLTEHGADRDLHSPLLVASGSLI